MDNNVDYISISDPKLIPRIKLFLKKKDPDSTIVADSVVQHLQATYKEYGRKKKNAFFHQVSKALKVARTEVFGSESRASVGEKRRRESSSDSEPENLVAIEDTNSLNLAMRNLYKKTNSAATGSKPASPSQTPDQQRGKKTAKNTKKASSVTSTPVSISTTGKQKIGTPFGLFYEVTSAAAAGAGCVRGMEDNDTGQGTDTDVSHSSQNQEAWTLTYSYTCTCGSRRTVNFANGQNGGEKSISDNDCVLATGSMSLVHACRCGVQRVFTGKFSDRLKSSVRDAADDDVASVNTGKFSDRLKSSVRDAADDDVVSMNGDGRTKTVISRALADAVDSDAVINSDGKSGLVSAKKKKLKRKRTNIGNAETEFSDMEPTVPTTTLNDFGGSTKLLEDLHRDLHEFFYMNLCSFASQADFKNCGRYLLHGPKGSGKTFLAECLAGHLKIPILKPRLNTLISGLSGDSEQRVRQLFDQALSQAPCVLLLEDIECLAPRQDTPGGSKDMMTRIASELGACIDDLEKRPESVVLIATTSKIDAVHRDLRIPGRFTEKTLGMPDEKSREALLLKLCSRYIVSKDLNLQSLARLTPGFVAGDLRALVHQAYSTAVLRLTRLYTIKSEESDCRPFPDFPQPPSHLAGPNNIELTEMDRSALALTEQDFMMALAKAQPAAKREGFATVPSTTWDDVGALQRVRAQLTDSILCRIRDPETASGFGLPTNSGIILVGPPGCGKTLVAKAMANEAGLNFMYIKGPELLDKYVGESEKNLREKFDKAQTCAPCLIFFDEMDTLCSNRQNSEGSNVGRSVTNQLLALMDGCGERSQVYVMGATNVIENVDPALQRPGRFDTRIFIDLPDTEGRLDILRAISKNGSKRKLVSCDLQKFAEETEGFSGADLKHLMDQASLNAMKERQQTLEARGPSDQASKDYVVTGQHFTQALQQVRPSVMKKDAEKYRRVAKQL